MEAPARYGLPSSQESQVKMPARAENHADDAHYQRNDGQDVAGACFRCAAKAASCACCAVCSAPRTPLSISRSSGSWHRELQFGGG